jgi:hypothetical protein
MAQIIWCTEPSKIILLSAKQKALEASKQAPLKTVKDCVQVLASDYELPEDSDRW